MPNADSVRIQSALLHIHARNFIKYWSQNDTVTFIKVRSVNNRDRCSTVLKGRSCGRGHYGYGLNRGVFIDLTKNCSSMHEYK
jgi:hypothetical protein